MNKIDTSNCDNEPIRYPEAIQPQGVLLVVSASTGVVEAASESSATLLGLPAEIMLGQRLSTLFGFDAETSILASASDYYQPPIPLILNGKNIFARSFFNETRQILVDIETRESDSAADFTMLYRYRQEIDSQSHFNNLDEVVQNAADLIHELTGFDRVMVYRFDKQWNGEVIAESRVVSIEPYLGLNFPASDIPKQARELFHVSKVRQIPDVMYSPSPLVSNRNTPPIDLGRSSLRSVSPIHLEYLKNMKVRATLVGSLVVDGRLWGLLSCQQKENPKYFGPMARDALGFIFQDIAAHIESMLFRLQRKNEKHLTMLRRKLINTIRDVDIKVLMKHGIVSDLLNVVNADGFALLVNGSIQTTGKTPDDARIRELMMRRHEYGGGSTLFSSNSLTRDLGLHDNNNGVAGGLFISTRQKPDITLIWFRTEHQYTLRWGGDPMNAHWLDENGRISPRKSFEQFFQNVHGQCINWSSEELESAVELSSLIEIEEQRKVEAFAQTILNSIPENIAVLDSNGFITSVNSAWKNFAKSNGAPELVNNSIGMNYRHICNAAVGTQNEGEALLSWNGIEAVLNKKINCFTLEYPCDSPSERLWFRMSTYPMIEPNEGAVIVHENISQRKQAEIALSEANERLEKRVIERTEQLHKLAVETTLAEDRERLALARDLHDDLGQILHIVKLKLYDLSKNLSTDLSLQMTELNNLISNASQQVRSLTSQLSPPALSDLGLAAALHWLSDEMMRNYGLDVDVRIEEVPIPVSKIESVILYRAARELLINVAKHATSDTTILELQKRDDCLLLVVEDDGIGIDDLDRLAKNHKGFGLSSVRERISYLGGTVVITSKEDDGTRAILKIPCRTTTDRGG